MLKEWQKRLQAMQSPRYIEGFRVTLHPDLLDQPLKWKRPRMVFVNSMSDLFHESIPLEFIQSVFQTMEQASQHIFQVLTKRSKRLVEITDYLSWPSNVWMGVSVENASVLSRVDHLRADTCLR